MDANGRITNPAASALRTLGWFSYLCLREFKIAVATFCGLNDSPILGVLQAAKQMSEIAGDLARLFANHSRDLRDG